jgi:DUF4097 and DUF4098 domain-containing protein YvlB
MRSETFSTPGPVRLNLEIPKGEIDLETAATDETHVELEATSGDAAVLELVDDARIELVRRGDVHEIVVETKEKRGFSISIGLTDIRLDRPQLRLRITCPHGTALDVRTKSADLRARGDYGAVEVKTASGDVQVDQAQATQIKSASGDIRLGHVHGDLDAHTASGDVQADVVEGDVHAQLVSGDLAVRDAQASVTANTVSGDQRFEAVQEGRIDLKAISGDVTVGIRSGSRFYVDANTVSGDTSSEFELGDAPAEEVDPDAPLVEVFAKTVSGDVRIERATAVTRLS